MERETGHVVRDKQTHTFNDDVVLHRAFVSRRSWFFIIHLSRLRSSKTLSPKFFIAPDEPRSIN